ncbi:hypothetical protein BD311DRAFT_181023 [Dichomitus squalens]|uniref:Uncharacterized protein n=1 Tax=Dichomitus squalens TaxID=114155 RepID=A0A4Q9M4T1_9APHY|nr:hypothetical protein BD311DRAFT_181023 [Dichomitus squalens]
MMMRILRTCKKSDDETNTSARQGSTETEPAHDMSSNSLVNIVMASISPDAPAESAWTTLGRQDPQEAFVLETILPGFSFSLLANYDIFQCMHNVTAL